jgi:DNA-binding response OmpR family regulator
MGPRVLLLDDDPQFVEEAQASLAGMGCEVTWLAGGDAGLTRAVTDRFDLVVASAELRGVNGFRLCNRVKRDPRASAVPVFLVTTTASSESVDAHRDLPTRADVYLRKPVVMAELLAQVRAHVRSAGPPPLAAPAPQAPAAPPAPAAPRGRANTVVGLAPPPRTLPPRPGPKTDGQTIQRLAHDLSEARREAEATKSLRSRVTELQEEVAKLTRDLGEARAAATVASTQAEQLRKARTSTAPPPSSGPAPRDIAAMREMIEARDYEILSLRSGFEAEQQASAEAWERVRVAEEARTAAEVKLRLLEGEVTDAARNLAVARKDRDMATRRAEDTSKRVAKLESELKEAREHLDKERVDRVADRAAVDEARAHEDRAEADARDRTTAAVAERELLHTEQMATTRAQHEAAIAALERQAAEAKATSERALAGMRAEVERATRVLETATRRIEELENAANAVVSEEAERRLSHARSAHAVAIASFEQARDDQIARLRLEHEHEVTHLQHELASERARVDAARRNEAVATDVALAREELEAMRAQTEERLAASEQKLHAAEERRAREVADAKAAAEAAYAKLDHERVVMELQRDAAIADATMELRVALAKTVQERDSAGAKARTQARGELEKALRQQRETDVHQATAELKIELEGARAAAVAELRREQDAELDRLRADQTRERSETAARVEAIERAMASAREALEGERRARIEERTAAAARIDALEALVATRGVEIEQMRDAVEGNPEVAALEGEIVMLRTELTQARRALEEHAGLARAADEQIERHRVLLERARDALGELLGPRSEGDV